MMDGYPYADLALARRVECAEACAGAAIVEARAQLHPGSEACWTRFGDSIALFDGIGSPITQNFGLGLSGAVSSETLELIEAFFLGRKCDVHLEFSPLADAALLGLLTERGYRLVETTNVMFRPVRINKLS